MRLSSRFLIGIVTFAVPAALSAQKMTPGTWTGTISPPGQGAMEASFDVRATGDTTKITLKVAGQAIEATNVKVEPKRLLFSFSPGNETVSCILPLKDDKTYSGDCSDPGGGTGVIVMRPPKS